MKCSMLTAFFGTNVSV